MKKDESFERLESLNQLIEDCDLAIIELQTSIKLLERISHSSKSLLTKKPDDLRMLLGRAYTGIENKGILEMELLRMEHNKNFFLLEAKKMERS